MNWTTEIIKQNKQFFETTVYYNISGRCLDEFNDTFIENLNYPNLVFTENPKTFFIDTIGEKWVKKHYRFKYFLDLMAEFKLILKDVKSLCLIGVEYYKEWDIPFMIICYILE